MNMHSPDPDRQKVAKLLRLLGSDVDGEVVAAARALVRTLKNAGSCLHELADTLEGGGKISQADMAKLYDAGFEAGRAEGVRVTENSLHGPDEFRNIGEPTFHEMAMYCQKRISRIEAKHHDFSVKMCGLTLRYEPSPAQAKYLQSMFLKAGGGRK
jgi:hypothetical protein